MLKDKSDQESFYGSYLYDKIVPVDHLLRKINQVVDFSFVNELVKDRYTLDPDGAHELFHYREQSHLTQTLKPITPFGFVVWYAMYALEVARQPKAHDSWPSEQRANRYANYYFPVNPGDVIWQNYG